jgi:hypothetical protein
MFEKHEWVLLYIVLYIYISPHTNQIMPIYIYMILHAYICTYIYMCIQYTYIYIYVLYMYMYICWTEIDKIWV